MCDYSSYWNSMKFVENHIHQRLLRSIVPVRHFRQETVGIFYEELIKCSCLVFNNLK